MSEHQPHPSQRGYFAHKLHKEMGKNSVIWLVTMDLGYGMFDRIRHDYPNRFLNVGAAEQTGIGIGVGLALEGKVPFLYSITPFLIYRPFETIRNYVNKEEIAVRLVASGRNRDYTDNGFSHWAEEDREVMSIFRNIEARWPENRDEIPEIVEEMIKVQKPWYLNLKR